MDNNLEEGNEIMAMCLVERDSCLVTAGKDTHVRIYDTKTTQVNVQLYRIFEQSRASLSRNFLRSCDEFLKIV